MLLANKDRLRFSLSEITRTPRLASVTAEPFEMLSRALEIVCRALEIISRALDLNKKKIVCPKPATVPPYNSNDVNRFFNIKCCHSDIDFMSTTKFYREGK